MRVITAGDELREAWLWRTNSARRASLLLVALIFMLVNVIQIFGVTQAGTPSAQESAYPSLGQTASPAMPAEIPLR